MFYYCLSLLRSIKSCRDCVYDLAVDGYDMHSSIANFLRIVCVRWSRSFLNVGSTKSDCCHKTCWWWWYLLNAHAQVCSSRSMQWSFLSVRPCNICIAKCITMSLFYLLDALIFYVICHIFLLWSINICLIDQLSFYCWQLIGRLIGSLIFRSRNFVIFFL